MTFAADYVRLVLNENFEDAKALFLAPLMEIHRAHLVMLTERGIVSRADARSLRTALETIDLGTVQATTYDGSYEDLFFHIESLVTKACGADVAGVLHTARSRNDIDMTMYRMRLREHLLGLLQAVLAVRAVLLELAEQYRDAIFPAHTHTQPAQPTTVAHYLMSVVEERERDTQRLLAALASVNRNPLGACAITGTGFPIDRERTSALLGFDGPTGNTYGSIATVDYLLESTSAASVTLVGVGRFIQDLLFWCTVEIGYLRLADGFVQSSSVMPQKRNPVALEHARALASKALGQTLAIPLSVHNTPFGDIVDTEDDLQPLVASAFKDATRAVALVAASLSAATFAVERMRTRSGEAWVTLTELADTLAREHRVTFRVGRAIASRVVELSQKDPQRPINEILAIASRDVGGREIRLSAAEIERVLSPAHFVSVRETLGGPGPAAIGQALTASRASLTSDRRKVTDLNEGLTSARTRLEAAVTGL